MTEAEQRLAALEQAVAVADRRLGKAVVGDDVLAEVELVGTRIRERLALSHDHTVVALAGPSGAGRSSLLNALADLDLAWVGARRATADEPVACVWGMYEARPLLDWLGVPARHQFSRESALDAKAEAEMQGLVVVDLPALDSAVEAQRVAADRLVDRADVLVWVVDPTKYADAVVHEEYLRRFAVHQGVSVVVFNRIDELPPEEAQQCLDDLVGLLRENGLDGVPVVATSAVSGVGIVDLRELLGKHVSGRRAADDRLVGDVIRAADRLTELVGSPGEVDDRTDQSGNALNGQAKEALVSELAAIARSGHPRSAGARAHVDRAVRRLSSGVAAELPSRWAARLVASMAGRVGELSDDLESVGGGESSSAATRASSSAPGSGQRVAIGVLQWLLLLIAIVGVAWLCVPLAPRSWTWAAPLASPDFVLPNGLFGVPAADLPVIPVAALVLAGGLLSGLGMAVFARSLRRRSLEAPVEADRGLRQQLADSAERVVFQPIENEIAAYRSYRQSVETARRR